MINTRWLQGRENLRDVMSLRKNVFCHELKADENLITDIYDDFAFSLVVYEDNVPVGTGRLLFKEGKFFADMVCVLVQHRGKNYGDLIVRMIVRKAFDMGVEKTYANVGKQCRKLFENIGFDEVSEENGEILMMKTGDVGGHCCKH
jgi:N-acetylglutamate synthase-like GNAT family acetyltransferase